MSTLVEAMARAMCEASGDEWRTGTYSLSTGPNFEWEDHSADPLNNHWRHKALAALKAMREPTPHMIASALAELSDVTVSEPKAAAWDWIRAHRAAIDAAIQEHSTTPPRNAS